MLRESQRPVRARVRWALGALVALTGVALTVAGCTASSPDATANFVQPSGKLIFSHEPDEIDASPGRDVVVTMQGGTLDEVTLVTVKDGVETGEVEGVFSADRSTWTNSDDLEYATSYKLTTAGRGKDGTTVDDSRSFTTVTVPAGHYFEASLVTSAAAYQQQDPTRDDVPGALEPSRRYPLDCAARIDPTTGTCDTFGVGQPIVAYVTDFPDKAAVEAALKVTTVPEVEGSWSWIDSHTVHWRPKEYWPAGTQVTVEANVLGLKVASTKNGDDLWGKANVKASFTIGKSLVAKAYDKTPDQKLRMDIFENGQLTKTLKISMGIHSSYTDSAGKVHTTTTYTGISVITERQRLTKMRSDVPCPGGLGSGPYDPETNTGCDPNYYEEDIPHALRLTDSGVYVHSGNWSSRINAINGGWDDSHGCISLLPDDAAWFYANFGLGDVVEVYDTGRALQKGNGTTDWNVPWDEWVAGSALPDGPPATANATN